MNQLLDDVETSAAAALHRCHHPLALDGRAHDSSADEWLPAVYDVAASVLVDARLNREPPSLVDHAQDAVSWLSRAIIELDQDAPDAAAAFVDALGRILALYVFADVARTPADGVGTGFRDRLSREQQRSARRRVVLPSTGFAGSSRRGSLGQEHYGLLAIRRMSPIVGPNRRTNVTALVQRLGEQQSGPETSRPPVAAIAP